MNKNRILDIYNEVYDIPELFHQEKVDFNFFRLCREDYSFVVISVYNEKHELLLIRDLNKNIGWELVGGYIQNNEDVVAAVNRVVLEETGLIVDELQPIAIIKNSFEFNDKTIIHRGIAFIALSRERINPQSKNIKIIYTKDAPDVMAYQNKKIFQIAKETVANKNFEPPYSEIDTAKKFFLFYFVNKYFTSLIGRIASKKIKNCILNIIQDNPSSILDACCGDDDFIFKLEKLYHSDILISNDISWKTISLIKNKNKKSNIIFTNHNVIDLPFKKKFDLVIFKNSLHHIDRKEQSNLIKNLSNIAKQLIIVDIEDPQRSNFFSRLWHLYYVYFLGDKGGNFLTIEELKEIIEKNIKDKEVNFGIINTIKGKYFYSVLTDKLKGEEVEIKIKLSDDKINDIKKQLIKLGATLKEEGNERDIYFTAPHRDFIKTKECLRIRERDNFVELTYKGPTTKEMLEKKQFWKSEINIPFEKNKGEVEALLELLNFKKVIDFTKHREKFLLGKKTITIDKIDGLGYFLEIEEIVESKKDRERVLEENVIFLKKFRLSEKDIVTKPYRDLVIENKGE